MLPGLILFGLGLSATVAPLTATALDSVEDRHSGVASGINNGVSRVAGLLAIAILGALVSGQFGASIDEELAGASISPDAQAVVDEAKSDPLRAPDTEGLAGDEAERGRGRIGLGRHRRLPPRHRGRRPADDRGRDRRGYRDPKPG